MGGYMCMTWGWVQVGCEAGIPEGLCGCGCLVIVVGSLSLIWGAAGIGVGACVCARHAPGEQYQLKTHCS